MLRRIISRAFDGMRAAIRRMRFAPRGYIRSLLHRDRLSADDLVDLSQQKRIYGSSTSTVAGRGGTNRTLVFTSLMPLPYCLKLEGCIGRALQERGWRIRVLTNASVRSYANAYHRNVHGYEVSVLEDFLCYDSIKAIRQVVREGLPGDDLDVESVKQIMWRGIPVGLHALATFLAQTPDGRIGESYQSVKRLRRILRMSMLLIDASNAFLQETQPQLMLGVEKGFVGTCEPYYTAVNAGVDYVQWVGCHEPESLMFKRFHSRNLRDHPFSISEESWQWIRKISWQDSFREAVLDQFATGYRSGAWFKYKSLVTDQQFAERAELIRLLNLDPNKKIAVIYSHILNDANLFYGQDIFPRGYEEWLIETIRAAQNNDRVNWVLKLHPANRARNQRLGYSGEFGEIIALKNAFGGIPPFLKVVYPDEKVSPFSFFKMTDYGITVRGTVGLELPCFGVPVLTAGTGRYAGKGFTYDSASASEYLEKIRLLHELSPLTEEQVKLATLYAYFVFKCRPTKYDQVFSDVYNFPPQHQRHRDISFKLDTVSEIVAHPQIRHIADFLEARDQEDFLDLTGLPSDAINNAKRVLNA